MKRLAFALCLTTVACGGDPTSNTKFNGYQLEFGWRSASVIHLNTYPTSPVPDEGCMWGYWGSAQPFVVGKDGGDFNFSDFERFVTEATGEVNLICRDRGKEFKCTGTVPIHLRPHPSTSPPPPSAPNPVPQPTATPTSTPACGPVRIVSFPGPSAVAFGSSLVIPYVADGAQVCTIAGEGWRSPELGPSGSFTTPPLFVTQTIAMDCRCSMSPDGTASFSVTVN